MLFCFANSVLVTCGQLLKSLTFIKFVDDDADADCFANDDDAILQTLSISFIAPFVCCNANDDDPILQTLSVFFIVPFLTNWLDLHDALMSR